MPPALSDPSPNLLLLVAVFVVIFGVNALRYQSRRSALVLAIPALLLAALLLIDNLFESPREESVRRVQEIVQATNDRSPDRFVEHVSDRFQYHGANKESLRTSGVWRILSNYNVRVAAWGFSRDDVTVSDENNIEIGFLAKGEADGKPLPKYVRAKFSKDPDGAYRLIGLAFYDPVQQTRGSEERIPNFP